MSQMTHMFYTIRGKEIIQLGAIFCIFPVDFYTPDWNSLWVTTWPQRAFKALSEAVSLKHNGRMPGGVLYSSTTLNQCSPEENDVLASAPSLLITVHCFIENGFFSTRMKSWREFWIIVLCSDEKWNRKKQGQKILRFQATTTTKKGLALRMSGN